MSLKSHAISCVVDTLHVNVHGGAYHQLLS